MTKTHWPMTIPEQLDRMEAKLDKMNERLGNIETWRAEMDGVVKAVKVSWTLFAAMAAVAGWVIAHFGLLGLKG